jgi:hypothetical protein
MFGKKTIPVDESRRSILSGGNCVYGSVVVVLIVVTITILMKHALPSEPRFQEIGTADRTFSANPLLLNARKITAYGFPDGFPSQPNSSSPFIWQLSRGSKENS